MEDTEVKDTLKNWESKVYEVKHTLLQTPTRTFKQGENVRGATLAKAGVDTPTFGVWLKNDALWVVDTSLKIVDEDELGEGVDSNTVSGIPPQNVEITTGGVDPKTGAMDVETHTETPNSETQGFQVVANDAAALPSATTRRR